MLARACFVVLLRRNWSLLIGLALVSSAAGAPIVWDGPEFMFSKAGFADPTLPENQDHITANVAITRANVGGIYNAVLENSYPTQDSTVIFPTDTEWATDINNPSETISAASWADLNFDTWLNAYGGLYVAGGSVQDRDSVVHLITDDI